MKLIAALSLFALSLSAFAVTKSVQADFTNLYKGYNAGSYKIDLKLVSKPTLSAAEITTHVRRFDNDYFCVTTAKFEVGQMTFSIAQNGTSWKRVTTQKLYGEVSHEVDGTECDLSLENLANQTTLHVNIVPQNSPIELPVKPFAGYEKTQVHLIPFDGYVYVDTEIKIVNNSLVLNPAGLLSERSVFSRNTDNLRRMFYYVQSSTGSSHLSLGNGHLSL
ncbi:hypothetical protein [Peredibacter starrii]|uniref:Adhesin domain-containing protein n=1 Tax=Peredibacter starrii TaxID=28202 RepID=A0AAX4HRN4_9BACT|nr:hypothetical protein [Peredibacter starrii]WPU65991.1 hypothetical protein SOO65_04465 [Peredibacter starrii]